MWRRPSMSAVFSLDQVLACTESITSEYSTTSQCLSVLWAGQTEWSLSRTARPHGFWFLVCYTATHLATQLPQRHIQVVRSNKVAQKRLTESNGTPAMDLGHMNVVLKWMYLHVGSVLRMCNFVLEVIDLYVDIEYRDCIWCVCWSFFFPPSVFLFLLVYPPSFFCFFGVHQWFMRVRCMYVSFFGLRLTKNA